jgi:hypothetical protein
MISADETEIIGNWILKDGRIHADENCERVDRLVENYLVKIGSDWSGWDTLFKDPTDGRYWERVYLQSEMHGGGPASLVKISAERAREKYKNLVNDKQQG